MATTKSRGIVCSGNLAAMSEGHGAVMPVGVFLALGQGSAAAHVARDTGKAFFRELAVLRFELDAEVAAVQEGG